jgi:Zn-dependent protease with chaperone function
LNFFEHQQLARRNSRVMVLLFALSVIAIVLAVNVVVGAVYAIADAPESAAPSLASVPRAVWTASTVVTLGIIFIVSLVNIVGLAGGGAKVAKMMGARAVAANSQDQLERRLLNIVEEMSLASGVRLPQVFIMDGEKAINAFAAGWSVSGAVVCVTRGTLERLTRDELQGVIGHEFSHILNGDMGLNIRMIGVLAGIVAIGSVGGFMMRNAFQADDVRAAIPLFLIGLAIFIVGYTGLFFARLIKAAVSRQREFLADASSVQFTRNPDGIAGALDQIRASGAGTLIQGRYAEEMSHLFFGQSVKMKLAGLFATHPPLEERIRRVYPSFQPSAYRGRRAAAPSPGAPAEAAGFAGEEATAVPPSGRRRVDNGTAWGRSAGEAAQLFGALQPGKIDTAARLLAALPAGLRECVREADGARAAIVSLLFAPNDDVMRGQIAALKGAGLESLAIGAAAAAPLTRGLGLGFHLPVIDLALPAIKAAPEAARKELLAGIEAVINADRRVSLHQFVVLSLVRHQLAAPAKPAVARARLVELQAEAVVVLSIVAHAGTRADASGARGEALRLAMVAGSATMGIPEQQAAAQLSLSAAASALEALQRLAPREKARLVKGLFAAVTADGTIRVGEAELMRLVGAVLDCPLPPMLDEIDPAALAA